MAKYGYTLVQHSGFGYNGKEGFRQAVEIRSVDNAPDRDAVKRVGGLLIEKYGQADHLEDKINYPEGTHGIYPKAAGTFADYTIDGLAIYIPVMEVIG